MQQYKNDMDKITVSDELKSKILAAADKKIKNSKIITFKKATARSLLRQDLQSAYRFRGLCTDLSHRGTSRSRSLNPR